MPVRLADARVAGRSGRCQRLCRLATVVVSAIGKESEPGRLRGLNPRTGRFNVPLSLSAVFLCRLLGMILTGQEIRRQLDGNIVIDPFDEKQLNPNSYNLRLHDELLVYEEIVLDMRRPNRLRRYTIPPDGFVLNPNQLYLGRTVERTETHNHVPMIEGRSSVGRLGLFVHCTAGFGDIGFCGHWTLQMFAVQPVRIYPGVPICEIFYHTVDGDISEYRGEKYQNSEDIQPSLIYREWEEEKDRQMRLRFGQELG